MDGAGVVDYNDGSMYEGEFVKGVRHGTGRMTGKDEGITEGVWIRDFLTTEEDLIKMRNFAAARGIDLPPLDENDTKKSFEEYMSSDRMAMSKEQWARFEKENPAMFRDEDAEYGEDEDKEEDEIAEAEEAEEEEEIERKLAARDERRNKLHRKTSKKREKSKGPLDSFNPKRDYLKQSKKASSARFGQERDK